MRFTNNYKDKIKQFVNDNHLTYYIDTMGCQMNENDSNKYSGILESMGFKKEEESNADLILFNTCCVRENAENTLFGRLGFLKNRKLREKNMIIVVVGCMTQQKHILDKIRKSYPFVDIILGTNSMGVFAEKLNNVIFKKEKSYEYSEETQIIEEVPIRFEDKYKASVSIIYGCNNFCSYCIVPYVRGRERSRLPEDILEDIRRIAKKGYKEIMLLGQNVNSYGNDFKDNEWNFPKLLKEIEKIDGVEIIRFMSPHPKDFSDELIDVIKNSTKIARQIHLPLQSGSTKILKEMNRKYTKEEYLNIVEKLRNADKEISFSTDIIVGFPGESNEDFEETLDVIRKVKFDQIYMFIYSKRVGTKAEQFEDNTKYEEKVERIEKIKKIYEDILYDNNEKMINKTYRVLVEGKSKTNNDLYTGRNSQNKVVIFKADKEDIGKIVSVKIVSQHLWYLKGEIIKKEKSK